MNILGFRKSFAGKSLAFVLNFFFLPGLGNITLGKYIAGTLQLLLTIAALILMGESGYESIKNLQASYGGQLMELADYQHFFIFSISGIICGAVGFVWAVVTYIKATKALAAEQTKE